MQYLRRQKKFSLFTRNMNSASFACELKFNVVQVDPATGEPEGEGFDEEYPLEDLDVSTSDFVAKVAVSDFRRAWE